MQEITLHDSKAALEALALNGREVGHTLTHTPHTPHTVAGVLLCAAVTTEGSFLSVPHSVGRRCPQCGIPLASCGHLLRHHSESQLQGS